MKVEIRRINQKAEERLLIECVDVTSEVERIQAFALTSGPSLTGTRDDRIYQFNLADVIYFEAVDEHVFACTRYHTFELNVRLYELEHAYADHHFVRCSKSFIINLMQLDCISPALNGRFTAHMRSGETIIISRQYVPAVKRVVMGGQ